VDSWERWRRVLTNQALPAAVVDLDALDHNIEVLLRAMHAGPTLRLASKSLRVPALLRYIAERGGPRVRGVMTWSAHETAWLAEQGFDDLLLAYPIGRADEAAAVAVASRRARVAVAVDHLDQARLLSAAAEGAGVQVDICLDIDVSWRILGGRAHLGVQRSPLRSAADAVALAKAAQAMPGLKITAVMAYEAQVAGLPDSVPGEALLAPARQLIKRRSVALAAARRREVVEALRGMGIELRVVNGGGTGSVISTSADPSVTEVTAGSGFLCSHLFDGYQDLDLQPALLIALGVVRCSDAEHVTCAGGGYVASGPPGVSRLPKVHAPQGLEPLSLEGFGEVQTPFRRGAGAPALRIGDPVICRPAKAGEPAERFLAYHLVRGDRVVETVPTVRGMGRAFF
jgi:D-serine deaminase-like pyridoxal phosphate-dependent protein